MNTEKKAVFLDRDGVINVERGDYISRLEDFEILPHVAAGLQLLRDAGFIFIVITNQGGIAKGLYDEAELTKMHNFMQFELHKHGIQFHDVYYCPHHPEFGHCLCRKPASLLVEKALSKHGISPENSIFIGDKPRDIACGEAVGVKGILIEPNENWIPKVQAYV